MKSFVFICLIALCFYSCECTKVECADSFIDLTINIEDSQGNSLIGGEYARYNPSMIGLSFSESGRMSRVDESVCLLCYRIEFTEDTRLFLELEQGDIDTIDVALFMVEESPCCEEFGLITDYGVNGRAMQPFVGEITIVK